MLLVLLGAMLCSVCGWADLVPTCHSVILSYRDREYFLKYILLIIYYTVVLASPLS